MATPSASGEGPAVAGDRPRWASKAMPSGLRRGLILSVAAAVVVIDQLTKTWALHHTLDPIHVIGTLQLALTFNAGAAFGLGRGITPVLVAGAIVLVVVLFGLGRAASRTANLPAVIAMGLLLGGACGNLADRLVRHHHGAVIDFIDLRWWPVFNVADACITVGALMLVLAGASRQPAGRVERAPAGSGAGACAPDTPVGGPAGGTRPSGPEGVRGRTSWSGPPPGSTGREAQPDW